MDKKDNEKDDDKYLFLYMIIGFLSFGFIVYENGLEKFFPMIAFLFIAYLFFEK